MGIIKSYKSLNLLISTTLGLDIEKTSPHTVPFDFLVGVGIEWFVLDNLSLSAEAGFSTDVDAVPNISVKFCL